MPFLLSKAVIQKQNEKFDLNSRLQTYQILTNGDQMILLSLSYFITTLVITCSLVKASFCPWGSFNNSVDKKGGGGVSKKSTLVYPG